MTEQEQETRDKALTEAMGECWHEFESPITTTDKCKKCGARWPGLYYWETRRNFSTWEGFGKLWEWLEKQPIELKNKFLLSFNLDTYTRNGKIFLTGYYLQADLINPDNFANALYKFLQQEEP